MDKNSIIPGRLYAVREHPNDELQKVKILEHVRAGKWRAEWVDPNPGLVDFVKSQHVIVPWGERRAFLRDERDAARLADAVDRSGFPGERHPVAVAVDTVLDATGEPELFVYRGVLTYSRDALERVATRAGIDVPTHPAGYTDRHGRAHLPWQSAYELAQAFARAEPGTVLAPIDADEREWATRSREPGESHLVGLLTEYRAAWALVRQWAHHDAAVAARDDEITRLRQLLTRTMWDLRAPKPDCEVIAAQIARGLHGR